MNPYEATLSAIDRSGGIAQGTVAVRGACICVRLDLVPDALVGDTLVIDSGVAVAVVARTAPIEARSSIRTAPHVPRHPR